jgi:hypothetical protein
MHDRTSRDEQIGWFHELASLPRAQLVAEASVQNLTAFRNLMKCCLPNHPAPEDLSAEEFAAAVVNLRENELEWNRALMSALVKADDLNASHGRSHAADSLRSFANSCPWQLFQEVAEDQTQAYNASP